MIDLTYFELLSAMLVSALIGFGLTWLFFKVRKKSEDAISEVVSQPSPGLEKRFAESIQKITTLEAKVDRQERELAAAQFTIRSLEQKAEKQTQSPPPPPGDN